MKLSIDIEKSSIVSKVKKHLSIIAKRAKDREGNSIFSEITTSNTEDIIYEHHMVMACEFLASQLRDICSTYLETEGESVTFDLYSTRWTNVSPDMDLTRALKGAISNFVTTYAIGEYLLGIHPDFGYYKVYEDKSTLLLQAVKDIALLKRPAEASDKDYGDITAEYISTGEGDIAYATDEDINNLND